MSPVVVNSKLVLPSSSSTEPANNSTPSAEPLEGLNSKLSRPVPLSPPLILFEHGLIIGLAVLGSIFCLVIILTWSTIRKRKRKADQLASILPKQALSPKQFNYGIRPHQSIEFVVPTISVPETAMYTVTEDSMSDSDCFGVTSGSDREAGGPSRRRHPAGGRYAITPATINTRLYLDHEQLRQQNSLGRVNFVLHYSFYRQQLLVTLLSAAELPLSVKKGHVNPFAKVRLMPEKAPKFVTRMQKNNANPLFNELFIFPAKRASLDNRILRMSIWHYDKFSRKYFIGQVHYKLAEAGIHSRIDTDIITDEIWCPLKGASQSFVKK
ncbi:Synaptotagmin-C [Halotydeus destructor]|nr:Synaptotagmin-C [Halotydeus destructor]